MKKSVQTLFSRVGLTAVVAALLISVQVQAADSDNHLKSTVDA
ncbi:hypothetical protein [uncultured Psychrobacter sp.]|nr:hypothetical protein [uncultured Psychrobacter sp.]